MTIHKFQFKEKIELIKIISWKNEINGGTPKLVKDKIQRADKREILKTLKLFNQIIFRLNIIWEMFPTNQNKNLELIPWIIKVIIENIFLNEKILSKQKYIKFKWQILEKATKTFPSLWKQHIKHENNVPKKETRKKINVKVLIKILRIKINPKPPNFNKRPAKIIDPKVGASTWAFGNQIWKIKRGSFTKNLNLKQKNNNILMEKKRKIFWTSKNNNEIKRGKEEIKV